MRRRRLFRLIALPLGLWFVALSTDLGDLDACPMHAAMQAGMGMSMDMPAGGAGMSGMAMASAPTAEAAPAPADTPVPVPHGPLHCTCIGMCCGCAMASLPSNAARVPPAAVVAARPAAPVRAVTAVPAPPRYLRPPAIGPPALHTA